jgi:hypothetical protein
MALLWTPPYQSVFDGNTTSPDLIAGAALYFYDPNTTDDRTVYSDSTLDTEHSQPVEADASGRFPPIYLPVGNYKVVLKDDVDGTTIWTADDVPGTPEDADELVSAHPSTPVTTETADFTVEAADMGGIKNCDPTGAAIAVTLISAVTAGDGEHITFKHAGTANTVTITTVSAQTIDYVPTTFVLRERKSFVTLVSTGANWLVKDHSYGKATISLFQQTTAPSGWTKGATHNDKALRVVTGSVSTGGSTAFSSVLAARTILQANLPVVNLSHSLSVGTSITNGATVYRGGVNTADVPQTSPTVTVLRSTGVTSETLSLASGTVSGTVALGGSGTAMDFAVNYVDVVLAEKD